MPLVWAFFVVCLMPSLILKIGVSLILSILLRSTKLMFLVMLSLALVFIPSSKSEVVGRVVSIQKHVFVVREGVRSYKVYAAYKGSLNDRVSVEGSMDYDMLSAKDSANGIVGHVRKVKHIEVLQSGRGFRTSLYHIVKGDSLLEALVYGHFDEVYSFVSSLAMHVSGVLILMRSLLRRSYTRLQIRKFEFGFVGFYLLCFGFSFSVFRLLLSRSRLRRDQQMLVLLCLFPRAVFYMGFLLPYGYDLVRGFSNRFFELHRLFVFPLLIRMVRYRLNLVEMATFRLQQVFCGVFFLLALLSMLLPLQPLLHQLVLWYQGFFSWSFLRRFDLNGAVNYGYVVLALGLYFFKKHRAAYTVWLFVLVAPLYPLTWRISYLDVNQGDATLIQSPLNAHTILIDTGPPGSYSKLTRSLDRFGVSTIDVLVLTHDDLDHVGNVERLQSRTRHHVISKTTSVPFLESYLTNHHYDNDNDNSLLFSIQTKRTSHLFMGDAGIVVEQDFLRMYPHHRFDVLKLGHHGSRTSTSEDFLAGVRPRYGVVSSNPKTYGHPHDEVMRSLYRFRVRGLLTHQSGNIRFVSGILFDYLLTDGFGFGIIR